MNLRYFFPAVWVSAAVLAGCTVDIGSGSQLAGQRCFQESDCAGGLLCVERVCTPVVGRGGTGEPDGGNPDPPDGGDPGQDVIVVDFGEPDQPPPPVDVGGGECRLGERRCVSDASYEVCIDVSGRPEFRSTRCPERTVCRAGQCVPIDMCDDRDGDGYGNGCPPGPDCNDGNAQIYPGRPERCGNGADDNCNGAIDEGCPPPGGCCPNGCGADEFCTTQCMCVPYDPLVCEHQGQPCAQEGAFFNGFYCFSFDGITEPRCWGICDVNAPDPDATCPDANSVCAFDSGDGQNGICMGACTKDPATGSSNCGPDMGCMHLDVDGFDGICTPTNPANGPLDPCNPDSFWDCSDGLVCVDLMGNGDGRCREACRPFFWGASGNATDCDFGHCLAFSGDLGLCVRDNMHQEGDSCQPQFTMCNDDAVACYPAGQFNGECYRLCRLGEPGDCLNNQVCSDQFGDPESDVGVCL